MNFRVVALLSVLVTGSAHAEWSNWDREEAKAEEKKAPPLRNQAPPEAEQVSAPELERREDRPEGFSRSHRPFYIGGSIGNPAPSIAGVVIAYQLTSALQIMASAGKLIWGDVDTTSYSIGARLYLLPWPLTPFVGGGGTTAVINGRGEIQGLEHTMTLPYLSVGGDLMIHGFRIAGGATFHFPIQLIWPFVDLGYAF